MRTTDKELKGLINRINELEERPLQPYSKGKDGKLQANVGNLYLSRLRGWSAKRTVTVLEIANEHGGANQKFSKNRYYTPAELYVFLEGYLSCLENK